MKEKEVGLMFVSVWLGNDFIYHLSFNIYHCAFIL